MRILYVEDDVRDAELTRHELARSAPHFELDVVSTLHEARTCLADPTAAYDVVLADLRLPGGTGLDLLAEIRDRALPVAVVILTGSGDEEIAVAALKAGADDYVAKRKDYLSRLPYTLEAAVGRFQTQVARSTRSLRVLYAEHNAADIDLTRRHLAQHAVHIHLDVVYSAPEALEQLGRSVERGNPYDVLLLDYHLPGMNAIELLKLLLQEQRLKVPTVLVTGQGDEDVAVHTLRLGAKNYLVKNPGYLYKLPVILENAYYDAELEREHDRLVKSERAFRLLAENARDAIYRIRFKPTQAFEYVSPAVTVITGYTPEDHYADPMLGFKLVHPDDRPLLADIASGSGTDRPLILRWVRKDGTVIWTEQHNTPIYDENGELVALEGIARDITIRQNALEALRVSEAAEREQRILAETLQETASALISAFDLDAVMKTILENAGKVVPHDAANIMLIENDQARPVYWHGYRPELEALVREFHTAVADAPNLSHMVRTGAPYLIADTGQSGDWIHTPLTEWVKSYVASPIRSHGHVIGFLNVDSAQPGFFSETHAQRLQAFADQASIAIERAQLYEEIQRYTGQLEQKVAERTSELQQSRARYQAIVEDQTDLVSRYLPGGILTFVNQAYCRYFNRTPAELLGTSLFDLVSPEARQELESRLASLDRNNPSLVIEVPETSSDGEVRWFQWSERMLFDEAGAFTEYQGVGRDITERKLLESQLRRMLQEAMDLNELRSRYVSMAAHDLGNPLAAIQALVTTIQMYGAKMTETQKEAKLDEILSGVKAMADILSDVMTIGRVEGGQLRFSPTTLDLNAFCQGMIAEVKQATDSSRRIQYSSAGSCDSAFADKRLLRHILGNLLSNAVKYSPVESEVLLSLDCTRDQATIRVQDRGIGIPAADAARLFTAFYRASNARHIRGTGLGLAIVKQSVDLHGGTITFESVEGQGTTFTVVLPISADRAQD